MSYRFVDSHRAGPGWNCSSILVLLESCLQTKPTRCTNSTNLFCHETLHVLDSSSVHHQEFIHCILSNGLLIGHTGL